MTRVAAAPGRVPVFPRITYPTVRMKSLRAYAALPVIVSLLIVSGASQASAALPTTGTRSATTGIRAIDSLLDRVNHRAASRLADDVEEVTDDAEDNVPRVRAVSSRSSSSSSSARRTQTSSAPAAVAAAPTLREFRAEVFRLVNIERQKAGLSAYTYNSTLEDSAQDYSALMQRDSCFSHTACGSTLKERMHASGYYQPNGKSYYYGENIARGQDTAKEVMEDWLNSPPHKAAILSEKFKEIGVGKVGNYWTQHFGAVK